MSVWCCPRRLCLLTTLRTKTKTKSSETQSPMAFEHIKEHWPQSMMKASIHFRFVSNRASNQTRSLLVFNSTFYHDVDVVDDSTKTGLSFPRRCKFKDFAFLSFLAVLVSLCLQSDFLPVSTSLQFFTIQEMYWSCWYCAAILAILSLALSSFFPTFHRALLTSYLFLLFVSLIHLIPSVV